MDVIFIAIGTAGGSLLGWIISSLVLTGKYINRLESVEKVAHKAPCDEINKIKVAVERIETNVEWLVKINGGKK